MTSVSVITIDMAKCFLLGAGASFGYSEKKAPGSVECPPRSWEFFTHGDKLGLFTRDRFHDLYEIVEEYAEKEGKPELEVDVEKVMIYAYRKSQSENILWPVGQLIYYIYDLLRQYTKTYDLSREYDHYQKLATYCDKNDCGVISLNYDLLFEYAVATRGRKIRHFTSQSLSNDSLYVSKIHGSINWVNGIDKRAATIGADSTFINVIESMYNILDLIYVDGEYNGHHRLSGRFLKSCPPEKLIYNDKGTYFQLAIVPPVGEHKKYDFVKKLHQTRVIAAQSLEKADELVVIGSRLRSYDDRLHRLIGENLSTDATITLVVGNSKETYDDVTKNIQTKIEQHTPAGKSYTIRCTEKKFGEYINTLV